MTRTDERLAACRRALKRVQEASEGLLETMRTQYPVGTIVKVRQSRGFPLSIQIEGYNENWWCDHGRARGINVYTGKRRCFSIFDVIGVAQEVRR